MNKNRILALAEVYFSYHPDGTEDEFWKRIEELEVFEDGVDLRLREGNPIMKLLKKKP